MQRTDIAKTLLCLKLREAVQKNYTGHGNREQDVCCEIKMSRKQPMISWPGIIPPTLIINQDNPSETPPQVCLIWTIPQLSLPPVTAETKSTGGKQVTLCDPLAGKEAGKDDGIGKTYLKHSRIQLLLCSSTYHHIEQLLWHLVFICDRYLSLFTGSQWGNIGQNKSRKNNILYMEKFGERLVIDEFWSLLKSLLVILMASALSLLYFAYLPSWMCGKLCSYLL